MILNIILIAVLSTIVINVYCRDYFRGMYLSIFLLLSLPTNLSIEISAAMPSITIHRVILLVMLLFWIQNRNTRISTFIHSPFSSVLTLFFISMFISFLFSDIFIISSKRYLYYVFESFMFYAILITSIAERKQLLNIILSVAFGICFTSLLGVIERYTGFQVIRMFGERLEYGINSVRNYTTDNMILSVYPHRILFGISCAVGLVYFLYLPELIKRRWTFFHWFLPVLIVSAALYFSVSRGPWLGCMLAIGFSTVVNPRRFMKKSVMLGILVIVAFSLRPGTLETITNLYHSTVDSSTLKGSSFRWRFSVVNVAVDQILNTGIEHFFFGYGAGSHLYAEPVYIVTSTGHDVALDSWDCEYAIILYESGILGMLCVVCLYTMILIRGMLYILKHPDDKLLMSLAISALLVIMFMKTNVSFFASQLSYIEYTNIAVVCILLMQERKSPGSLDTVSAAQG